MKLQMIIKLLATLMRRLIVMQILGIFLVLSLLNSTLAGERLFFSRHGDIYTAKIDDWGNIRNLTNLTNHPANDTRPSLSPDGRKIVFESDRDTQKFTIYVMNSTGGKAQRVLKDPKGETFPVWADGSKIAFQREGEIWLVNSNGTELRKLGKGLPSCWTPDGKLVFTYFDDIYIMDINTGEKEWFAKGYFPVCSKGGKIAYISVDKDKTYSFIIETTDREFKRKYALPPKLIVSPRPCWSPDETRLIFTAWKEDKGNLSDNWKLYILDLRSGRIKDTRLRGAFYPNWWGNYTYTEPLNLFYTLWSLIKMGKIK